MQIFAECILYAKIYKLFKGNYISYKIINVNLNKQLR